MTRFILASSSPARKKVLQGAGFDFEIRTAPVNEDAILAAALQEDATLPIGMQVALLAEAKAQAVATEMARELQPERDEALVILGCDSMLESSLGVTGKPKTPERAFEVMSHTSGQDVVLVTGHHLIELSGEGRAELTRIVSTTVHMADISDTDKHDYIATGEPLQVAGAFTIDGFGGPFIRGVTGDHHNVLGLSLPVLREMLAEFGYTVSQFWVKD